MVMVEFAPLCFQRADCLADFFTRDLLPFRPSFDVKRSKIANSIIQHSRYVTVDVGVFVLGDLLITIMWFESGRHKSLYIFFGRQ